MLVNVTMTSNDVDSYQKNQMMMIVIMPSYDAHCYNDISRW